MVHKCRRKQAPTYLCNLFQDRLSVSGPSTRSKSQLNLPKCRLSTGQRSFAFRGAKEYHSLPDDIRASENILSFKRKAAAYLVKTFPAWSCVSFILHYLCKYFYSQYLYIFPPLCNFLSYIILLLYIKAEQPRIEESVIKVYITLHYITMRSAFPLRPPSAWLC